MKRSIILLVGREASGKSTLSKLLLPKKVMVMLGNGDPPKAVETQCFEIEASRLDDFNLEQLNSPCVVITAITEKELVEAMNVPQFRRYLLNWNPTVLCWRIEPIEIRTSKNS